MELTIRPMTREDWGEVVEIYYQGILSNMATYEYECPTYDVWDKAHLEDCRLVAESDFQVVAWAALLPYSNRSCFSGVAELSIYVDSNHKRKGVGEKLLTALVQQAEAKGFWSLQAVIFEENVPSLKLHEKCGFRRIGTRERLAKDRFGQWRTVVLMEYRKQSDKAGGCDCEMMRGQDC